jgi:hypothetical protein
MGRLYTSSTKHTHNLKSQKGEERETERGGEGERERERERRKEKKNPSDSYFFKKCRLHLSSI